MALYKVTDKDAKAGTKPRVVKADSSAAALKHVASTQYDVEVIMNATTAAELLSSGITMEISGQPLPKLPLLSEDDDDDA